MDEAPLSITDFITDGSLAALCEAIGRVAGARVVLRDPAGRTIIGGSGERMWRYLEEQNAATGGVATAADLFTAPIHVSEGLIGTLAAIGGAEVEAGRLPHVRVLLSSLASIVGEICEREIELHQRVDELDALQRVSSMLVGAIDTDALLDVALRSAIDVMGADAGTVRSLDESGNALVLRAWAGLSDEYVSSVVSVPVRDLSDAGVLRGEVVCVENLLADTASPNHEARRSEGLVSMIGAGLVFRGRPLGVMRLFTRTLRTYSDRERSLLRAISEQSAAAMTSARLLETEKDHQSVQRQVRLAADVQRRLLPVSIPTLPGVQAAARYIPSLELSGDFYDFIDLNGHLGVAVGDVVGKGFAAALLMASVRSSLRAYAQDLYHLDEIMDRVNRAMCRDTLDREFATIFYGVIDPATRRLTYCNAGHEPALVLRCPRDRAPESRDVQELSAGGMVVGVDPEQIYQRASFDLREGDVLLINSDGLSDAVNFQGEKFGRQRVRQALLDALRAEPDADANRIADHLIWEHRRFAGMSHRTDDTTLIVLRVAANA
ncbi:MAG: GAF domain-containing protein [Phycisphaerales bacterium]|nr:MAG: GAF domain-containing protein [Phycisphaerales bacterium]